MRALPSPGFTLVEMAIGMLVIALLLGSILVPLSAQVEQRKINETQKALEEIRESLLGFAIVNGYLPCPDKTSAANSNDGLEDFTGVNCDVAEGNIPWATLGAPASDSWGNRFRYRVDAAFASHGAPLFGFGSTSGLEVCGIATCANRLTTSGDGPVAVILSHGKNGLGAMNASTNLQNALATSADELENTDADIRFVSRTQTSLGTTAGEFDDVVIWLPKNVLFNRMVAAGKLP